MKRINVNMIKLVIIFLINFSFIKCLMEYIVFILFYLIDIVNYEYKNLEKFLFFMFDFYVYLVIFVMV